MKRKVISGSNLGIDMPLSPTLISWLVLDRTGADGWIWGVIGSLLFVGWIAWVIDIFCRESVDVINGDEE